MEKKYCDKKESEAMVDLRDDPGGECAADRPDKPGAPRLPDMGVRSERTLMEIDRTLDALLSEMFQMREELQWLKEKFFEHQHSPAGVLTQVMDRP